MSAKATTVFCVLALFAQSALSQCTSRAAIAAAPGIAGPGWAASALASPYGIASPCGLASAYGLAAPAMAAPCGYAAGLNFSPTSGGGLPVASSSAIAPVGLSVASENYYEGVLAAIGELPFVGTVALEGVLPTAGAGAVNHACGSGRNAMISEGQAYAPDYAGAYSGAYAPAAAIAPAFGAAAIAPASAYGIGIASPFGYGAGYAGGSCGCGL